MEYVAIAKNIKISPRKVRLVADGVKKQNLKAALSSLSVMNKRAAGPIKKAIDSAAANALNNFNADKNGITIKNITVTEGTSMKRYHYAGRGRTRPYKKRTSHITVILSDDTIKTQKVREVQKEDENEKSKTEKQERKGSPKA